MSIGNILSNEDFRRKKDDYFAYLRLQSKLNERGEKAVLENVQAQKLGIPMQKPQAYASAEEAIQDKTRQQEIALIHLKDILPFGSDAVTGLQRIRGEEVLFNKHWSAFKQETSGQVDITPDYFKQLWDRFKEKLARSNDTGIHTGLDATQFNQRLRGVGHATGRLVTEHKAAFGFTATELERVRLAIETAIQNRDQTKLEDLGRAVNEGQAAVVEQTTASILASGGAKAKVLTPGALHTKNQLYTFGVDELKVYLKDTLLLLGWRDGDPVDGTGGKLLTDVSGTFLSFATGGLTKKEVIDATARFEKALRARGPAPGGLAPGGLATPPPPTPPGRTP